MLRIYCCAIFYLLFTVPHLGAQEWRDLIRQADSASSEGLSDQAIKLATKSVNVVVRERGEQDTVTAKIRHRLGSYLLDSGELSEARIQFEKALFIFERLLGTGHPLYGTAADALGVVNHASGNLRLAKRFATTALEVKRATLKPDDPNIANACRNLGLIEKDLGSWSEAKTLFSEAQRIRLQVDGFESLSAREILLDRASLALAMGNQLSCSWLLDSVTLSMHLGNNTDSNEEIAFRSVKAQFLVENGELDQARDVYASSISVAEKDFGSEHPITVQSKFNLGVFLYESGELQRSDSILAELQTISKRVYGGLSTFEGQLALTRGSIYADMYQFELADSLYGVAHRIATRPNGDLQLQIASENNLIDLALLRGDFAKALPRALQIVATVDSIEGHDAGSLIVPLITLGQLAMKMGDYSLAGNALRRCLAVHDIPDISRLMGQKKSVIIWDLKRRSMIRHRHLPNLLTELGRLHSLQGSYDSAAHFFLCSRLVAAANNDDDSIPDSISDTSIQSRQISVAYRDEFCANLTAEAWNLYRQEKPLVAFEMAIVAAEEYHKLLIDFAKYLTSAEQLRVATQAESARDLVIGLLAKHENVPLATVQRVGSLLLSHRSGWLREMFGKATYKCEGTESTRIYSMLHNVRAQLSSAIKSGDRSVNILKNSKVIDSLFEVASNLEKRFRQSCSLNRDSESERSALNRISESLGSDESLVVFGVSNPLTDGKDTLGSALLAVIYFSDQIQIRVLDGSDDLFQSINEFYRLVSTAPTAPSELIAESKARAAGKVVSEKLFGKWKGILEQSKRIFLQTDGMLGRIPFAALPVDSTDYLIEKSEICYVPSYEYLPTIQRKQVGIHGPALIVGGVDFSANTHSRDSSSLAPLFQMHSPTKSQCLGGGDNYFVGLPASRSEVSLVDNGLAVLGISNRKVLIGRDATETEVTKLMRASGIVHFATHGFSIPDSCISAIHKNQLLSMLQCGVALTGANDAYRRPPESDGLLTGYEILFSNLQGAPLVTLSSCQSGIGGRLPGSDIADLRLCFLLAGASGVIGSLWSIDDYASTQLLGSLYSSRKETPSLLLASGQRRLLREYRLKQHTTHPYYWAAFAYTGKS